jgi:hypothetical protein
MRSLALLCALSLEACAAVPPDLPASAAEARTIAPAVLPLDLRSAVLGVDRGIVLLDTRAIGQLRRSKMEQPGLSLMTGQRVALWVGVGVVVMFLVTDWMEDNVAFFP